MVIVLPIGPSSSTLQGTSPATYRILIPSLGWSQPIPAQRRAAPIIGDLVLSGQFNRLATRRDIASLCVFYRIYHAECSRVIRVFTISLKYYSKLILTTSMVPVV